MDQFDYEIQNEANFNSIARSQKLERSLSIPIPNTWVEKDTWCSAQLMLYLSVDQSINPVWSQVIEIINEIGYIRSGNYKYDKKLTSMCIITSHVELHTQVDLYELKEHIRESLGVQCKIYMENFSFPQEFVSK